MLENISESLALYFFLVEHSGGNDMTTTVVFALGSKPLVVKSSLTASSIWAGNLNLPIGYGGEEWSILKACCCTI
jgi:hypothetical protein